MRTNLTKTMILAACAATCGCASMGTVPKYENGQYVPPAAEHPLKVTLQDASCDGKTDRGAPALFTVVATALVNFGYDRFINWLDMKQAGLSASSSGIATDTLLVGPHIKRCLILARDQNLEARFSLQPTATGGYWHMTPYSLTFLESEAKEGKDKPKNIVADIQFSALGEDGKLSTYFQATFDLGTHKAGSTSVISFVGQDSGPYGLPKVPAKDSMITTKVVASVVERGKGRDWIRAVTDSLREKENREQILKPILEAIGKDEE